MSLMAKIRHRAKGHLFHGDELARAYIKQPDGTMKHNGYVVHLRCVRTGCDYVVQRHVPAVPRPSTDPVVSLKPDN